MTFTDTSALVGLARASDQWHAAAREFVRSLGRNERLMTSDFVLDEVLTILSGSIGVPSAAAFVDGILRSPRWQVLFLDGTVFDAALVEMGRYQHQRLSFTDCTSFALMRLHGMREAFTFDEDFGRCGFQCLPEGPTGRA